MRTRLFYVILVVLMGSLILFGKCRAAWGGEIEEPTLQGVEIAGYTLELGDSDPIYQIPPSSSTVDDITALLRECLEYIEDGSVDVNPALSTTLGVYRPLTRDDMAQYEADRAQYEADRYRRETALHGKIKEMIKKLEGSK